MNSGLRRRIVEVGQWLRHPLAVLTLAALTAAVCGFGLHPQGYVLAIGLAALIAVGVAWPWFNLLGLRGTIRFDRARAREGEAVAVHLHLRNRAPWGAWGLAVDSGFSRGADAALAHVGGWRQTEAAWDFVPDRRGVYPAQPPRVSSGFPFGLMAVGRSLATTTTLIVWPRTFAVGPIPTAAGGRTSEGNAPRNRPGGSGDFLGVRPYRRGDSLRRVHWPQTARSGQMVICELQSHAVPQVQVVLDTDPRTHAGLGADGSLEWSIRVAASFVAAWINTGAEVSLISAGSPAPTRGGSIAARRAAMLDTLARVDSTPTPLNDLLAGPLCRRFASGLRVVITTDRAVAAWAGRSPTTNGVAERFVVLRAGAFGPTEEAPAVGPLPIQPWVWLDDPARVPQQVRHAWKEINL